ncbi:MAG: trigger factor [Lachnospiraceae bacterium]|nr:trigger factor [Lachnospiraceae bacterium]
MKKKIAAIFALLLAVGTLAGCGDGDLLQDVKVSKYIKFSQPYTGLNLTIPAQEAVTDEDIEWIALNAYANAVTAEDGVTNRAVELGDTVNIDYSGAEDGVAFEGGTATDQSLAIGSGSFIDGFEDGLIGVMPGETVELNLTFPENYNPEMAGKSVVFTVTVNYIYPGSISDMKDEVVAEMTGGEFTNVEDFLGYCREYLEFNANYDYTISRENEVISALEAIVVCEEAPEKLVARYAANVRASLEEQATQYGVDVETFCSYYYQSDAETYINEMAEASAKQAMMFQYIANEEGLNVSDEELETSLQKFAEENGVDSVETLLQTTEREEFREYFMFEKVVDFIIANGNVTEG